MSNGTEEEDPRGLKVSHSETGQPDITWKDAGYGLEGGGEEDVSEESLSEMEKEVTELAVKVAEYREKGPVAFDDLLEKSLAQVRSSVGLMDPQVNDQSANSAAETQGDGASSDNEKLAQGTKLLERLASVNESLPVLLRQLKVCRERLDKAMTALRQRQARDSPLPPALAPDPKGFLFH